MSQYMFGVSKTKLSRKDARRADRIARQHGCSLIEVNLPGTGYQRWFAGPNLGHPFDRAMAEAVYSDLEQAGLSK